MVGNLPFVEIVEHLSAPSPPLPHKEVPEVRLPLFLGLQQVIALHSLSLIVQVVDEHVSVVAYRVSASSFNSPVYKFPEQTFDNLSPVSVLHLATSLLHF